MSQCAGIIIVVDHGKALAEYVEQTFTLPSGLCLKFKTEIGRSTIIPTAQKLGKRVFQTEPTHKVTEQYRELAREFEAQFEQLQPLAAISHR